MPLIADWSVKAEPIAVSKFSNMAHANPVYIKQVYRSGDLGPPPNAAVEVLQIPLYHAAAFIVVQEARKKGIAVERILEALPAIAGAAYIHFLLTEIRAGHCVQRGGTPALNTKLWALLHRPEAKKDLEEQLPGGPIETHRYACFTESGTVVCDDLSELKTTEEIKVVDAWSIPELMKPAMPGTFLYTHID